MAQGLVADHVGFVVDKVALGQGFFFRSASVFPVICHSISARYSFISRVRDKESVRDRSSTDSLYVRR